MMAPLTELRGIVQSRWAVARDSGIPRLALMVGDVPRHELEAVYEPMLNFVLQGGKRITIGTQVVDYDPERYFLISVDVPASGQINGEAGGLPYAALALTLDLPTITDLAANFPDSNDHSAAAFSVSPVTPEMTDAWLRMTRLIPQGAVSQSNFRLGHARRKPVGTGKFNPRLEDATEPIFSD